MKKTAILAAFAALLMSCKGKPATFENSGEYVVISGVIADLENERDSLFKVSESLPAETPDAVVLDLMEQRANVEAAIRHERAALKEAEEKFYQRQSARR